MKTTIDNTAKGVVIRIDSHGAIPANVTIANARGGLKQMLQRDHLLGDESFDARWHLGGDEATLVALLTEPVRKALDKAGKRCSLRVDASCIEASSEERELMKTGTLVKDLQAVAQKLVISPSEVRRRLDAWAKTHADATLRARAAKLVAGLEGGLEAEVASGAMGRGAKAKVGEAGALSIAADSRGALSTATKLGKKR